MAAQLIGDIRPHATKEDVISLVDTVYGMKVLSVKQLNGYEDQNFHVKVDVDRNGNIHVSNLSELGYIFKLLNTADTIAFTTGPSHLDGQIEMQAHLHKKGIVCPRHVSDKNGKLYSEHELPNKARTGKTRHIIRLLEYIDGETLVNVVLTPSLAYRGGIFLTELHNALQGFEDERLHRNWEWSLHYLPMLRAYLHCVENTDHRNMVEEVIDKWDTLKDLIAGLPQDIVHGDFNEQNILVKRSKDGDATITGILDFQDVMHGPRVFDVAIYIMYMMTTCDAPLEIGGYCLAGYVANKWLSESELKLLYYSVAARFTQSLVMGLHNYSITNDPYTLVTQKLGWDGLTALWSKSQEELISYWLSDKFVKSSF